MLMTSLTREQMYSQCDLENVMYYQKEVTESILNCISSATSKHAPRFVYVLHCIHSFMFNRMTHFRRTIQFLIKKLFPQARAKKFPNQSSNPTIHLNIFIGSCLWELIIYANRNRRISGRDDVARCRVPYQPRCKFLATY